MTSHPVRGHPQGPAAAPVVAALGTSIESTPGTCRCSRSHPSISPPTPPLTSAEPPSTTERPDTSHGAPSGITHSTRCGRKVTWNRRASLPAGVRGRSQWTRPTPDHPVPDRSAMLRHTIESGPVSTGSTSKDSATRRVEAARHCRHGNGHSAMKSPQTRGIAPGSGEANHIFVMQEGPWGIRQGQRRRSHQRPDPLARRGVPGGERARTATGRPSQE